MEIRFVKREHLKEKPDQKHLGFGKYMTDYMFVMDWKKDEGWVDARIVPYEPITLDPACVVLHYAQETFEGLKAYRTAEGKIQLFRPEMNARRMIRSNERLCMPAFPEDMFVEAIKALVKVEEDWVPSEPDTSLYIRLCSQQSPLWAYIWHPPINLLLSAARWALTIPQAWIPSRSWWRTSWYVR